MQVTTILLMTMTLRSTVYRPTGRPWLSLQMEIVSEIQISIFARDSPSTLMTDHFLSKLYCAVNFSLRRSQLKPSMLRLANTTLTMGGTQRRSSTHSGNMRFAQTRRAWSCKSTEHTSMSKSIHVKTLNRWTKMKEQRLTQM